MSINLTNPIFHDDAAARAHLEGLLWPNGAVCAHCKSQNVKKLAGKSTRPGVYWCNACEQPFSVTVGTVMERSKIPLSKWVLGFQLMAASKKGVSSHQLHRMLGITYKSAWFLSMRIREAMDLDPETNDGGPIGGEGKTVEVDEVYLGGRAKNVRNGAPAPKKHPVVALVERGGQVRAKHVPTVTAKNVRDILQTEMKRGSEMHTDDTMIYYWLGRELAPHKSVNHSKSEYVSADGKVTVNSAESFFALVRRQMMGTHHAVSEHHLQRYISEQAFKWNNRSKLGIEDDQRAINAIKGAAGRRLTYKKPLSDMS